MVVGEEQDVLALASALSVYIRSLGDRLPSLARSVFVCARCCEMWSHYVQLTTILDDPDVLEVLRAGMTSLTESSKIKFAYTMGQMNASLESVNGSNEHLRNFAETIGSDDVLETLFDAGAPLRAWASNARKLLETLESIRFEESLLARNFDREPGKLVSAMPVTTRIHAQVEHNAVFRFGWHCEDILFPGVDLHYLILPGEMQCDDGLECRWVLCLWTERPGSLELRGVGPVLEQKVDNAWPYRDRLQALLEEAQRAPDVLAEWRLLVHEVQQDLSRGRPDARVPRRKLTRLDNVFQRSLDLRARQATLEFMYSQRDHVIAERINYAKALQFLGADRR